MTPSQTDEENKHVDHLPSKSQMVFVAVEAPANNFIYPRKNPPPHTIKRKGVTLRPDKTILKEASRWIQDYENLSELKGIDRTMQLLQDDPLFLTLEVDPISKDLKAFSSLESKNMLNPEELKAVTLKKAVKKLRIDPSKGVNSAPFEWSMEHNRFQHTRAMHEFIEWIQFQPLTTEKNLDIEYSDGKIWVNQQEIRGQDLKTWESAIRKTYPIKEGAKITIKIQTKKSKDNLGLDKELNHTVIY